MPTIAQVQTMIGVPEDGTWSPTDQAALLKASDSIKRDVQRLLRVTVDAAWGPQSQGALNALRIQCGDNWMLCKASSFADPADLQSFKKCKATGRTDLQCFAVGDNGVGEFGDITAQTTIPFVAIHKSYMLARWGSVLAAAHREVEVRIKEQIHVMKVGDRISEPGRIDLNPAALLLWKLKAPMLIDAAWRWR